MNPEPYLPWVVRATPTCWWHDSADPREIRWALDHGAVGVTTNPYLVHRTLAANQEFWAESSARIVREQTVPEERAEALTRLVTTEAARPLLPIWERTEGRQGWVCAQVNPLRAGDRAAMQAMAIRFANWAPNITVKLPATAAGLDVLQACVAQGISATATVSFTVAQVLAVAERHHAGTIQAQVAGRKPGGCFAVLMVGRLDDYLRERALDAQSPVHESDIQLAGIAVAKRAAALLAERHPSTGLIIAAFRGLHHMTELVGGPLVMSIAQAFQQPLLATSIPCAVRIEKPVAPEVLQRLARVPDFQSAYEPDGLKPGDFLGFGLSQRTLAFFAEAGWKLLEQFQA